MGKMKMVINVVVLGVSLYMTYLFSANLRIMFVVLKYRNTVEEWNVIIPLLIFTALFVCISYVTSKSLLVKTKNKPLES